MTQQPPPPRPETPGGYGLCTRDDLHAPHVFTATDRFGTEQAWCGGLQRGDREYGDPQTDFAHMEPGTGGDLPHWTNAHDHQE